MHFGYESRQYHYEHFAASLKKSTVWQVRVRDEPFDQRAGFQSAHGLKGRDHVKLHLTPYTPLISFL
jgi:hypothetical protein